MARPSKPASVLQMEGKSHRTKREMAVRERGEAALLTGRRIKESPEVRANEDAHAEYKRVIRLMESIEKNDALYEAVINRYCMQRAEEQELLNLKNSYIRQMHAMTENLETYIQNGDVDAVDLYKLQSEMQKNILKIDGQLATKRRDLLALEKENCMTITAALRTVPKGTEKQTSPLLDALGM